MIPQNWPAWYYGPDGASQICQTEADVPNGWQDHPSKIITPERTGSKPLESAGDRIPAAQRGSAPLNTGNAGTGVTTTETGSKSTGTATGDVSNTLDADGWAWDAKLHSGTATKTGAGLWRMKVGVKRPAAKPGFPKPVLDL